ncbi:hypothetical protein PKB_4425 [Pseudomonas knackmussii B13]|uniref:Tyr recombinase domain-containing protein n=2 Tax=Pseudomonas TaxID=286 RepID=A0A024HL23_PSEKB|nr:site-specific integrase [Pseudomonas knackmussii]CDF85750.1 hypothetical protein PKB_4425 [Pseudomonas knackmussii B13]
MSQRTIRTPHMIFSRERGFLYVRSLPKALLTDDRLPKQVRWPLGQNHEIARDVARQLNDAFDDLLQLIAERRLGADYLLQSLGQLYLQHQRVMQDMRLPLGSLITPNELAKGALELGYERLADLEALSTVLYADAQGDYVFVLLDRGYAERLEMLPFERYDVSLGTPDLATARWKAAYLLDALEQLKRWTRDGYLHVLHPLLTRTLAWEQFVRFVAKPREESLLEQRLPTSLTQLEALPGLKYLASPQSELFRIHQGSDGGYSLRLDFHRMGVAHLTPVGVLDLELQTTDWILANLLFAVIAPDLLSFLTAIIAQEDIDPAALLKLLDQIHQLLEDYLKGLPKANGLPELPPPSAPQATLPAQTQSVLQALSGLLPETQAIALNRALVQSGAFAPPASGGLRYAALVERFKQHHEVSRTWTNADTRIQNLARLDALVEIVGPGVAIEQITRADVVRVRDALRLYPKGRNKTPGLRQKPLAQIMTEGGYDPIHPRTLKRYFAMLKGTLDFAVDQGLLEQSPAQSVQYKAQAAGRSNRSYTREQLRLLLSGPVYTLEAPPRWRLHDYKFWLPLLGAYQGARLNELCQLRVGDVRQEAGIWYLSLNTEQAEKRLKNSSSERDVPLHRQVLAAGFLEFVEQRRQAVGGDRQAMLFDGLPPVRNKLPGATASKWFLGNGTNYGGYVQACGLGEQGRTFHGLRHSFIAQFRAQKLDMQIAKALVGHTDHSVTGHYGRGYPLEVLQEELDRLDHGVSLEHIHYRHYLALQAHQAPTQGGPTSTVRRPVTKTQKRNWRRFIPLSVAAR